MTRAISRCEFKFVRHGWRYTGGGVGGAAWRQDSGTIMGGEVS